MASKKKIQVIPRKESTHWVDKLVGFFSPRAEFKRAQYRHAAQSFRKYEGAAKGRRTKNWKAGSTSANKEIDASLVTVRNRTRQMVRDDAYAAKGLQAITSNVVGRGIFTQVKVDSGKKNQRENKLAKARQDDLSRRWKAWAGTTACDFDGRHDIAGLQRLVMRGTVEGGEMLVRKRQMPRRVIRGEDGVPVEVAPVSLQVLEGDFLDINGVVSSVADNGNHIVQGIEFDSQGKRVAYHLFKEHPGNNGLTITINRTLETVRVPAEEILHVFRADRAGQLRGISWFAPILIRLRDFNEFEDARLFQQKVAACFTVFIKDLDGTDSSAPDEEIELLSRLEPGAIEKLPPGKEIQLAEPPAVAGYKEFTSVSLHALAAGLGISYEALTGDLSEVNFSSARMGFIEMGRNIEEWRNNIMIAQFMAPTFNWWMDGMEMLGVDVTQARPFFAPPERVMIDPAKETNARKDAVRAGLLTLSEAVRMAGKDPERHFEEMKKDKEKLDELGLILDTDPAQDANRIKAEAPTEAPPAPATPPEEE